MSACYLIASKAVDRVRDYGVLFRKLIIRGIPSYIIRLLRSWCCCQYARVQRANVLANSFSISNVQTKWDSFFFFLSAICWWLIKIAPLELWMWAVDSVISSQPLYVCWWHLSHLPLSDKGLLELINICFAGFAQPHDVVFNTRYTPVSHTVWYSMPVNVLSRSPVLLCSKCLPYIDSYKYLGHTIRSDLADDAGVCN